MPSFQVNTKWAAMSEIVPGLYISGVSALKPAELLNAKISCIINATSEVPNLQISDIDRMKLWLEDSDETDISAYFHIVCDRIELARRDDLRVLVHCVAGVSRSAALCLAYLIKFKNMSLRQAYQLMAARRLMVRPNLGFWRQLIEFEKDLRGKNTVRLVQTASFEDASAQIMPDVYFPTVLPTKVGAETAPDKENAPPIIHEGVFDQNRQRRFSGEKFVPKLDPLPELEP